MESNDLPDSLKEAFTSEVREQIVNCLDRAYKSAVDTHDEARGSNETTFGFNLYWFAVHELAEAAANNAPFRVIKNKPLFRMAVRDYTLCCHRVGYSAAQDIRTCFPGNEQVAIRVAEEQLWFEDLKPSHDLEKVRSFVIAHLGNPMSGIEAVYLCAPKKNLADEIEWAHTFQLWKRESEKDLELPIFNSAPQLPPEEQIPDTIVLRKKSNIHKIKE